MPFLFLATFFSALLAAAAAGCWFALPHRPELWRQVPRERYAAAVIGLVCLLWTARLAAPMLEGGLAGFRAYLIPGAFVLAAACFWMLDYLMARALGGLVLLAVNELLHLAFVRHALARPVFALVCYMLGVAAMFMIATPYRFRDLLEQATLHRRKRAALSIALFLGALTLLVTAVATEIPVIARAR